MVELRVKKYPGLVDQGTFFKNINDQIILVISYGLCRQLRDHRRRLRHRRNHRRHRLHGLGYKMVLVNKNAVVGKKVVTVVEVNRFLLEYSYRGNHRHCQL
jgi:hypothetical protein